MKTEEVMIYEPDRFIKTGFFKSWKEMIQSLLMSRELIWRLFLRDFNARYRQSLLGVAWAILNPVAIVGVFVFLNRSGILNLEETKVPYPVFALIGLSIYGLFSIGLSACANSIVGAGPMVVKINFPKISLVISSFGQAFIELTVRLALLIAVFVIYGVVPRWTAVLLPFAVIPMLLLTLGIGLFFSLVTGIFRDTIHVVSLFTTFLLFLTPVLYPPPKAGLSVILNTWNPLSHLIIGCRDLILSGNMSNHIGFLWSSVFSIIVFLISWRFFYLAETKIAERV